MPDKRLPCIRARAPRPPELVDCTPEQAKDLVTPGSCGRVNNIRLLDYLEELADYAALVTLLCHDTP